MAKAAASLAEDVASVIGEEVQASRNVGGSSWASCIRVDTGNASYFVKACSGGQAMIEGEAWSLAALHYAAKGTAMTIPAVHYSGEAPNFGGSMLITDFLSFGGRPSQYDLGYALAQMHLAEPLADAAKSGCFGFPVDNTLGPTPQPNTPFNHTNWVDFFRKYRLQHQLKLTCDSKLQDKGNMLCENLDVFFENIEVKPSVLHGDLWAGNIAAVDGKPSLFDPATSYGHHEAEFGMSWCASLGHQFWSGYRELMPKEEGFEDRHNIYTLYHILNHYNIFGGGYDMQSHRLLDELLPKCK